jgi:hypothetical protein
MGGTIQTLLLNRLREPVLLVERAFKLRRFRLRSRIDLLNLGEQFQADLLGEFEGEVGEGRGQDEDRPASGSIALSCSITLSCVSGLITTSTSRSIAEFVQSSISLKC